MSAQKQGKLSLLVDYGPDSEDDSVGEESPPPQSDEPPTMAQLTVTERTMLKVHSQSSLLSHEEIADRFDEEFEHDMPSDKVSPMPTGGKLVEPRPPRRPSDVYDEDDEFRTPDEEEEEIGDEEQPMDVAAADGSTPRDKNTPRSEVDSVEDDNLPLTYAATLTADMPPSPTGECDPELEQKFERFFAMKAQGTRINDAIKRRKDFNNPAIYEFLVKTYGIDEKGSNFDRAIYDPHNFQPSDFYDALGDYQAQQMHKNAAVKKGGATAGASNGGAAAPTRPKTRFEIGK